MMMIRGESVSAEDREQLFEPKCSTPGCPYPAEYASKCRRCQALETNARDYQTKPGFRMCKPQEE